MEALASEDLVKVGERVKGCPYYASRNSIKQSQAGFFYQNESEERR